MAPCRRGQVHPATVESLPRRARRLQNPLVSVPVRRVLDTLVEAGWKVRERSPENALGRSELFPPALRQRYPNVPSSLVDFLGRLDECVNPDETAWFLTAADYAGTSGAAFEWNEWEKLELETFKNDPRESAAVREFWNKHIPFYNDVSGDYAYFAVRVVEPKTTTWDTVLSIVLRDREPKLGAVVYGVEEFRAPWQVTASFPEFLEEFAAAVRDPDRKGPLGGCL